MIPLSNRIDAQGILCSEDGNDHGEELMHRILTTLAIIYAIGTVGALAADEGTRHIVGSDVDVFFMNDRVFGTVAGHPL